MCNLFLETDSIPKMLLFWAGGHVCKLAEAILINLVAKSLQTGAPNGKSQRTVSKLRPFFFLFPSIKSLRSECQELQKSPCWFLPCDFVASDGKG